MSSDPEATLNKAVRSILEQYSFMFAETKNMEMGLSFKRIF